MKKLSAGWNIHKHVYAKGENSDSEYSEIVERAKESGYTEDQLLSDGEVFVYFCRSYNN